MNSDHARFYAVIQKRLIELTEERKRLENLYPWQIEKIKHVKERLSENKKYIMLLDFQEETYH